MYNEKYIKKLRCERVNTCAECNSCRVNACGVVKERLNPYTGIRFTSDGFDCALPVAIDSHTVCSFNCLYCFSDNLPQSREKTRRKVGQTSLKDIEDLFSGGGRKYFDNIREALNYHKKVNGFPCPIQLGAITDPLDNIERQQGWFLEFVKLAIKYDQPIRISTKGKLFLLDEYIDALKEKPHLFWVAFSLITPDDKVLRTIDKKAPDATTRLKCMKRLSDIGVKTSLRLRPMIPGISDSTKDYPKAYKTLIEKAAEAGARAISYEVAFLPGMPTKELRSFWEQVEKMTGHPLFDIYRKFGKKQACTRASYKWTEGIMHAVAEEAKKNGLTIGVSDPAWKQLTETGCCCGILPDDPVFGNWRRASATNQLLEAKLTGKEVGPEDIISGWEDKTPVVGIANTGPGPTNVWLRKHTMWGDKLREQWNTVDKERGPYVYFQGALVPVRKDEKGNIYYKYRGLKRHNLKTIWRT